MTETRGAPPETGAAEPRSRPATSPDRRRRGSWLAALLGVSLILVGVGAVVVAGSLDESPGTLSLSGRDAPVNVGARDPRDISAHNSPTLVRNPVRPANLAVSSRIDTPFFSCALHVSVDGGSTWSRTAVPAPKGEEAKCFGPDVAFAADGTLHLSFVTLGGRGNVPHAVWVSSSKDGGRTLSEPVKVHGRLAFQVRLAADPNNPRRLHMTWLQGAEVGVLRFTTTQNPIQATRSDDGGATWQRPVRVSDASRERVVTPAPVVGPEGELYVLYLDLGEDTLDYAAGHEGRGGPPYQGRFTLVLARSVNAGADWEEVVVDDDLVPIHRFVVFFPPAPSVAVDRGGRVYAAFHDARRGDADVWLWSLGPRPSDRTGPTRVNDTEERDGTWQYLPKLAVAPNGRLDVLYYDRRANRTAVAGRPRNVMNEVSLQSSFDGGRTFTRSLRLSSQPFDSRIGFAAKEGLPDLGSRLGLISEDRWALGLWTDTRAGIPATQKQDLAAALAIVTAPARRSEVTEYGLRFGGLALGLTGLVLLGSWMVRRP